MSVFSCMSTPDHACTRAYVCVCDTYDYVFCVCVYVYTRPYIHRHWWHVCVRV